MCLTIAYIEGIAMNRDELLAIFIGATLWVVLTVVILCVVHVARVF